ncbi:MAG: hypothetical protein EXS05_21975 [Planctomycetaceae bacterium]|nr:hypothetical protein [Planctomycetaceae bacterium]
MGKIIRLSAEQRENLIAYLDGELEEPGAQEVEQVLAESVVARHEIDMLSRTWDLLNVLPGVKVSDEFSRKTLSSIRAAEQPKTRIGGDALSRNLRRGFVLAAWAALVAAFGFVGYQGLHSWVPNEASQLFEEYDVIANLDDYQEIGDIEFLRTLKEKHTLAEHHEPSDK